MAIGNRGEFSLMKQRYESDEIGKWSERREWRERRERDGPWRQLLCLNPLLIRAVCLCAYHWPWSPRSDHKDERLGFTPTRPGWME